MAISDALDEGWGGDPAYDSFGLRSYLGTTVSVADEFYGTLCFADTTVRDDPLLDKEKALVEIYGQWVGYILTHWDDPPLRKTRVDTIEGRTVSSEAIDSMMKALTSSTRRAILMTLLRTTTGTTIASLEQQLDCETSQMQLYHVHLPKLADFEYINWDREADTISRGPKFSEVKPLVQLLKEYEAAFPK
jgi:GAF domain-containing protein